MWSILTVLLWSKTTFAQPSVPPETTEPANPVEEPAEPADEDEPTEPVDQPAEPNQPTEPQPAGDPSPAEEPATTSPEGPSVPTQRPFHLALADAKTLYFQGHAEQALATFQSLRLRLSAGEAVDWETEAECMVFLGEVQHQLGDDEGARDTFRTILEHDLEHPISPYQHGMEVVGLFETVRRALQQERAAEWIPPTPTRNPMPFWGYLPFGAPQFGNKHLASGVVVASLQAAFGGISIGMHVHLNGLNGTDHPEKWTDEEVPTNINGLRYGVQWPATFAFYATWIGSSAAAALQWRAKNKKTTQISVYPGPGNQTLMVTARF